MRLPALALLPLAAWMMVCLALPGAARAEGASLRVAALANPPFVVQGPDGLQGLSIAAFNIIAARQGWTVRYILEPNLDALTTAIITHQADIGIGGITPTPELGLIVDFSDANQVVPLALAVRQEGAWSRRLHVIGNALSLLFSSEMLILLLLGLAASLVAGFVIRRIEERRNGQMFPPVFRHNAWWAAQTLIAHNCGAKLPETERGRYLAIVLMLGGTVFTAEITAVLTTGLATSIRATAPITSIGDVGSRPIATVRDSYAKTWLQQNLVNIRSFPTAARAVAAVKDGTVAGVAYDQLALAQALRTPAGAGLVMVGDSFGSHPHAFMLPKRSPYRDALNESLTALLPTPEWQALIQTWLGRP